MPEPLTTAANEAAIETSVMTGMELGEDDLVRLLDVSNWQSRRDALERMRERGVR